MSFTLTEKRPAAFRAPAPKPREVPLGPVGLLLALRQNPVETWTRAHFEKPILVGRRVLGEMAVVSEPAAIRRVLLDNVTNYRKDDLQRRVLSPGLGDGLLTAEGKQWRAQRRTVARCSRRATCCPSPRKWRTQRAQACSVYSAAG